MSKSQDSDKKRGRKRLLLQPKSVAATKLALQPGPTTISVSDIQLRKDDDTRSLSADHVVGLAECISILGLLQPIVVDTEGHLLAGGHRLAALQLLAIKDRMERMREFYQRLGEEMPAPETLQADTNEEQSNKVGAAAKLALRLGALNLESFQERHPDAKVSVQVVDVPGRDKRGHALAVETAENTVRRQYTLEEVRTLAERLKAAGYKEVAGKPKQGVSPLMPALAAALGRSKRQIQRILGSDEKKPETDAWKKALAAFEGEAKRLKELGKRKSNDEVKVLLDAAQTILDAKQVRKEKEQQERQEKKEAKKKAAREKRAAEKAKAAAKKAKQEKK